MGSALERMWKMFMGESPNVMYAKVVTTTKKVVLNLTITFFQKDIFT